jgi:hypothetical protein
MSKCIEWVNETRVEVKYEFSAWNVVNGLIDELKYEL